MISTSVMRRHKYVLFLLHFLALNVIINLSNHCWPCLIPAPFYGHSLFALLFATFYFDKFLPMYLHLFRVLILNAQIPRNSKSYVSYLISIAQL